MRRLLIPALITAACAAAPASADLREARFQPAADGGRFWLAFDGQPSAARLMMTPGGAVIDIAGVEVEARRIEPASGPFGALLVSPEGGGAALQLDEGPDLISGRAEVREGGVLLVLEYDASAPIDRGEARPVAGPVAGPAFRPRADAAPAVSDEAEPAPEPAPAAVAETEAPAAAPIAETRPDVRAAAQTACAAAAEAVEADPWDFSRLAEHGDCLDEAGDVVAATEIYERVLAFEPEHFDAAYALAEIRAAQGNINAARRLFGQAAAAAGSDAEAASAWARARSLAPQ